MAGLTLSEAQVLVILKAFNLYSDRHLTYLQRTMQACLKEVGLLNAAMKVCYDARDRLAQVGLLGDLAAIFEQQEAVFEDLQEAFNLQAENSLFLSKTLKDVREHGT